MDDIRTHRVAAFCEWLDSLPSSPQPFHEHPTFRFFRDLTPAEFDAAGSEMRARGQMLRAEVEALTAESMRSGSPDEWLQHAMIHLKAAAACDAPDGVLVSQNILQVVLAYIENLEGRLGVDPTPPSAA